MIDAALTELPSPTRGRRPGWWLLGVVLLGLWPIAAYLSDSVVAGETHSIPPVGGVTYVAGTTEEFMFSVRNAGLFAASITEVEMFPTGEHPYTLLKQSGVDVADVDHQDAVYAADARTLESGPMALPAGEERAILVHAYYTDCDHYIPGSGNEFRTVGVSYRYLGLPHRVEVPIAPIVVTSPGDCPAR